MEFDNDAAEVQRTDQLFQTAFDAPQDELNSIERFSGTETNDDALSMRTQSMASVAPSEIEEYNREKQQMHTELQALKEAADSGDPDFHKKLDALIARTGSVKNIQKVNLIESIVEEGEDHV